RAGGRAYLALVGGAGVNLPFPAYPIAGTLRRIRPWLVNYCRSEMEKIGTYHILDHHFTLYARPSLCPSVAPDDWITGSGGVHLSGSPDTLRRFPNVRLTGWAARMFLPRDPGVSVQVIQGETSRHTIPAHITFPDPLHYVVEFNVPPEFVRGRERVELQVMFDTFWVPKNVGLGEDVR